jgi:hypothetical protein
MPPSSGSRTRRNTAVRASDVLTLPNCHHRTVSAECWHPCFVLGHSPFPFVRHENRQDRFSSQYFGFPRQCRATVAPHLSSFEFYAYQNDKCAKPQTFKQSKAQSDRGRTLERKMLTSHSGFKGLQLCVADYTRDTGSKCMFTNSRFQSF